MNLWARLQNYEKRLLASTHLSLSVCLSVRMEYLGSKWTDFQEVLYLSVSGKSVEKIQFSSRRVLCMKTYELLWQYLAQFFIE